MGKIDYKIKKLEEKAEKLERKNMDLKKELGMEENKEKTTDNKLGRRNFLKKVGVGALGTGALSIFPATSKLSLDGSGIFNNGTRVVPGLGNALADGKVFADDGKIYDTVQKAVNNASSYVEIGPGIFNESVTVSNSGITIKGSGEGTVIDGGTKGDAIIINGSNIIIKDLSVKTKSGADNNYNGIHTGSEGNFGQIKNVLCTDSDNRGFLLSHGSDWIVEGCRVSGTDSSGIHTQASNTVIRNCHVENTGNNGIQTESPDADNSMISNCVIIGAGGHGIQTGANDTTVGGNRVQNSNYYGISFVDTSKDCMCYNNRISGSGSGSINEAGNSSVTKDSNI